MNSFDLDFTCDTQTHSSCYVCWLIHVHRYFSEQSLQWLYIRVQWLVHDNNNNQNVEHDIITRDANSVSWAEIWEFSKSQRDIFDAVTISKIIVFEIICYIAYHSAARFTFPIEQPSNKAAKCGIRRSWKLKVKPNLGCCCNIAITISYISVFVSSW